MSETPTNGDSAGAANSSRARRLRRLVLNSAETLFPGYFALVMATGVLSVAAQLLAMRWIAIALVGVNVIAYAALCALTLLRVACFPKRLFRDLIDHVRGPGFFTAVAGTCVFGVQLLLVTDARSAAAILWDVGLALWCLVMYTFFTAVTVRPETPDLERGLNGAWLMAAVSTQSISILGTLLAAGSTAPEIMRFVALCMFLLGCMLYLAIITLIFHRLFFVSLTAESLTPPYWINMGAVAITTLAGSTLMLNADNWPLFVELRPFLAGFTLFFWAGATWWIPLLLVLTIWRHVAMRYPVRYEPQLWSVSFPLGMYTAGTLSLSQALDLPFLAAIPRYFVFVALAFWLLVAAGLAAHLCRALRIGLSGTARYDGS